MLPLNCVFIIQGEGRGHLTQALALKSMLSDAGHTVSKVFIGLNERRQVPGFFLEKIGASTTYFESPNFAVDQNVQGIKIWPTIVQNLKKRQGFKKSLNVLKEGIKEIQPDVVINFYEPLTGVFNFLHKHGVPVICIGHQYMFHHPVYPFPPGKWPQKMGAKFFTRLTSFGASRRLALSFYEADDKSTISVMPPLLRKELFEQPMDKEEDFFLIYLLNKGYADAVIKWHEKHPEVRLHCFWDNQDVDEEHHHDETLTFHQLSDWKFLDKMAHCKGLICTAGFESICEAMYLGKSILAVPVKGHVEQYWNALDLMQYGGGIYDADFNIERLFNAEPIDSSITNHFREWVDKAPEMYIKEIEKVASKNSVSKAHVAA
ncbi:MAG: hypothetical protein KTR29_01105 [Rhodothermaceae bacterium]|nr:hypothetical protein [Rhodothermaceae bacterium]